MKHLGIWYKPVTSFCSFPHSKTQGDIAPDGRKSAFFLNIHLLMMIALPQKLLSEQLRHPEWSRMCCLFNITWTRVTEKTVNNNQEHCMKKWSITFPLWCGREHYACRVCEMAPWWIWYHVTKLKTIHLCSDCFWFWSYEQMPKAALERRP